MIDAFSPQKIFCKFLVVKSSKKILIPPAVNQMTHCALPYFYAIKFLKLNKIEKVFEIKSQIVQLKLNHKPTGA